MTRLRSLALGGAAAALIMAGATSKSFAIEAGTFQYLAGGTIGIPGGAAAPPGLYTGVTFWEGLYGGQTGNQGGTLPNTTAHGVGLQATAAVVPLVWSTGWNFLGASYSVAVIQPFVLAAGGSDNGTLGTTSTSGPICASPPLGTNTCFWQNILINTIWQPINLSWKLGGGWFVSAYFSFQGPDGTKNPGSANPDYWTLAPGAAISWLSPNWNVSLNMVYQIYTASAGTGSALGGTPFGVGYTNGNQFAGDWHVLYKIGKWEFGPVGYFVWQTTADTAGGGGCAVLAANAVLGGSGCAYQNFVGLGGLVGYDFGPVDLQVWATDTVWSQNTAEAGWTVWTRFGFRLWAPEAPKPLVAKN
jgi:hypothetical protein